jgi:hypothetical protein
VGTKWALLKTIQQEPADNSLSCYAMADLLEEGGWLDLAFTYRWMGWYNRRPGKREGQRLRKRFVWYKKGAFGGWPSEEAERSAVCPMPGSTRWAITPCRRRIRSTSCTPRSSKL